jgi:hypothetical protein
MKNLLKEAEAVSSLCPQAKWTQRHDGSFDWSSDDITQPTQSEIDAEVIRLQTEYDAQAYSRKREAEYPSVQECVHAILDDDLDALQAKRADIKTKYPKG